MSCNQLRISSSSFLWMSLLRMFKLHPSFLRANLSFHSSHKWLKVCQGQALLFRIKLLYLFLQRNKEDLPLHLPLAIWMFNLSLSKWTLLTLLSLPTWTPMCKTSNPVERGHPSISLLQVYNNFKQRWKLGFRRPSQRTRSSESKIFWMTQLCQALVKLGRNRSF